MAKKKKQHKIPKTYIRGWSHNEKSVKSLLKNDGKIIHNDPIDSMFSENYKYSYDLNNAWSLPEAEEEIFLHISNYKIVCNNEELQSATEMHKYWYDFDNWEIYDKSGKQLNNEEIRKNLVTKKSHYIEDKWNEIFERRWPENRDDFIQAIEVFLNNQEQKNVDICYEKLKPILEFMVMLYYRSEINRTAIDMAYQVISTLLKDITKYLKRSEVRNSQYFKYTNKDESSVYLHTELFLDNSSYLVLKSPSNKYFHTSDNPSFKIMENGMTIFYFPVSPQYCLLVCVDNKETFAVKQISECDLDRVNNNIDSNASNKIILPY